jgi:hypothetical protein
MTIFAPSHGAHSCAKILFAVGEKDERAKMAANEFILWKNYRKKLVPQLYLA